MIEFDNVSAGYGGRATVSGVSMRADDGAIFTLIGPNGSGKSTLLRTAAGLLKPQGGRVLLDGRDIADMDRRELARKLAYLPQSRDVPVVTVGALALHGRFPYAGMPSRYSRHDREIADAALERLGIFQLKDRLMSEISGGERQKAYIAMALAQDTRVIMLDEPTTYLDIQYRLELMNILKNLKNDGRTVIAVMHDLDLALESSERMAVLHSGGLECCAAPDSHELRRAIEKAFNVRVLNFKDESGTDRFAFAPVKQ